MLRVAQLSRQVPAAVRACAAQHRRCGGGARETGNPPRSPDAASPPPAALSKFWSWTTQERADPPRYSASWWLDKLLICTVFAITGSASLYFVRPALGKLGIEGSLKDGPWSYRFASVFMVTPFYTMILLTLGTLAGRHPYFAKIAVRMWARLMPAAARRRLMCAPARRKADAKISNS